MSGKFIPVAKAFAKWEKDPEYRATYDALEEEFALASQIIGARAHANLSQAELAARMNTSQSVIARLESGRWKSSMSTLAKLAKATGTRLRIKFEPVAAGAEQP